MSSVCSPQPVNFDTIFMWVFENAPPPPTNREGSSLILEPPHLGHNLSSFIQIKFGSHFDYDNIYFGIICDKKYRNTYYISSHSILWRRTWAYRQANQWVMQFSPSAHPLPPYLYSAHRQMGLNHWALISPEFDWNTLVQKWIPIHNFIK